MKMTYREWLAEWLENYAAPTLKARTYVHYTELLEGHVIPHIGELELADISALRLQHLVTELLHSGNMRTGKGLSPSSVNSIITLIKSTLRTAESVGLAPECAADKLRRPRTAEKQIECLSVAEQKRLEQYIIGSRKPQYLGILLCLYTGLRLGELLALRWDDVDLKARELYVRQSCHYGRVGECGYARITEPPKTTSSVRTIPLPKQLIPHLRALRRTSCSAYLVANGEQPISVRSYQRTFELLLARLNIPHRGFHALRHTFATRAIECGMDVRTLSELLGHKSPGVTLSRYAHSLTEHKRDMMNRLGKLL